MTTLTIAGKSFKINLKMSLKAAQRIIKVLHMPLWRLFRLWVSCDIPLTKDFEDLLPF